MLPGLERREFHQLLLSVGKTMRARRPLSPVEVGELCARAIDEKASPKEITEALQMTDRGMITKFLRLTSLVPEVRHLVSWGTSGEDAIGFSVAAQLARIPEADQLSASEAVLKYRLTRNEMISVIQLLDRSGDPLKACIERVVRRRPVLRVQHVILGGITSSAVSKKLQHVPQIARDELLKNSVVSLFPEAKGFTAKLGPTRFAIIGGKGIATTVATDSQIECKINTALEDALS